MNAEEKTVRPPMAIKNLAELKRIIKPGTEFMATYHAYHPDTVGLVRVVTEVQTNAFYSVIKDQPDHKYSICNDGQGLRTDFEKAGDYVFDGDTIKVLNSWQGNGSVLYEFQVFAPELNLQENEEETSMEQQQGLYIPNYFDELSYHLREEGFNVGRPENRALPVIWQGVPLCQLHSKGGATYPLNVGESRDLQPRLSRAIQIARTTSEYLNAMTGAPPLKAKGLDGDYRVLSEYNGTVLAAQPTRYGAQFVTWEWVDNHQRLWQGHYFQDYERAKVDFATRSGLVQADKILSDEQLTELYRSAQETLEGDFPITDERRKLLEDACWKMASAIPDLTERVEISYQKEYELSERFDQTM